MGCSSTGRRGARFGAVGVTVAAALAIATATATTVAFATPASATAPATPAAATSTTTAARTAASTPASAGSAPHYLRAEPVCSQTTPGHAACQALHLVRVGPRTPGARAVAEVAPASRHPGPAGGYTPRDLATAYGFNPKATRAKGNILAIVDAYNDPRITADLNAFDAKYGFPRETSASFKVVGQDGSSTLPIKDPYGWSIEEALDVEAARAVCRLCKIILVETKSDSFGSLAAGVNTAARLGAKEISNSYGGSEIGAVPSSMLSAYDHKKVIITASTGDDGWHDWDYINANQAPGDTPELPSSLSTVVGVGGTTLKLNSDGTRASERVWNNNGPGDQDGMDWGPLGATGGGCSTVTSASTFQQGVSGYPTLGCGSMRSATDIAAVADPYTGFDIISTYNYGEGSPGWMTLGGTSLSAPVVAAMWALAGGAQNVDYPALTLYGHLQSAPATYDVRTGGNGACGSLSPTGCRSFYGTNPNDFWQANVDCGFRPNDTVNVGQCYARPGYDGPSGVGAPKGLKTFRALAPTVSLSAPASAAVGDSVPVTGSATDPFPGGTVSGYSWTFGDGATAVGASSEHLYSSPGTYTVTLTVTDSYGVTGAASQTVTVS